MPAARAALVVLALLASACRLAPPLALAGSYRGETKDEDVELDLHDDGTAWYLELPKGAVFYGGYPRATWSFESPEPGVEFVKFLPGDSDPRSPVTFAVEAEGGRTTLVRADGTRLRRVK